MLRSTKPPRCPHCKARTESPGQRIHPDCIDPWLSILKKKQEAKQEADRRAKAKVERAEIRQRKEKLKTAKELLPKAQKEVNRWCRLRDVLAGRPCISCGATFRTAFGGVFDAGHFRSVGSAGHLRFYTPQIRLQCVRCNRDLSGNSGEFRRGLVAILGLPEVERIESMYWMAKWDVDYLRRLIQVARKRANRLEKRLEEA